MHVYVIASLVFFVFYVNLSYGFNEPSRIEYQFTPSHIDLMVTLRTMLNTSIRCFRDAGCHYLSNCDTILNCGFACRLEMTLDLLPNIKQPLKVCLV